MHRRSVSRRRILATAGGAHVTVRDLSPLLSRMALGGVAMGLLLVAIRLPGWTSGVAPPSATGPSPESAERAIIVETVRRYRPGGDPVFHGQLSDAVQHEARSAGIDPLLITAMVATESSFRTAAVSRVGAVGLMQVRPWVGRDLARRRIDAGIEWRGPQTLTDPHANVRLGVLYYSELLARFDGDRTTALEAYNRGPSRVRRELNRGRLATTGYSKHVLELYRRLEAKRAGSG